MTWKERAAASFVSISGTTSIADNDSSLSLSSRSHFLHRTTIHYIRYNNNWKNVSLIHEIRHWGLSLSAGTRCLATRK